MRPYFFLALATAILGLAGAGFADDKSDKEKPKKLPPEAAELLKGSAEDFIKRFDKNNDGVLSKDELPPRMAEQVFDKADTNGDGKLDKKEVQAMLEIMRKRFGEASGTAAGGPEIEQRVKQMLERMDTNKDGKISKDEAQGPIADNFDRLDTNQDGFLDKDELRRAVARMAGGNAPPGNRQDLERIVAGMLEKMDTNKDGKLSKDEVRGPLAENFDRADTNKDGFLDKQELLRVAERMRAAGIGGPGRGEGRPQGPGRDRPDFDSLDSNADGRLTREELKGKPLADKFDEIDTNKDGKIDRKEFEAYFKKQAEKREQAEKK